MTRHQLFHPPEEAAPTRLSGLVVLNDLAYLPWKNQNVATGSPQATMQRRRSLRSSAVAGNDPLRHNLPFPADSGHG
jgi:hypothetical protein